MGAVWRAVQEPLGRNVALKILKPTPGSPEKQQERHRRFFARPGSPAGSTTPTRSRSSTTVSWGCRDSGAFFLVMEYLEGHTLLDAIRSHGLMRPELALHIAVQIVSSLLDAHRAGLVHRDLKPPNVMLVTAGRRSAFSSRWWTSVWSRTSTATTTRTTRR